MSNRELVVESLPCLAELEQSAIEIDSAVAKDYAPSRRREFLAWRAIVRRVLGEGIELGYNSVGAPIVVGNRRYIGVSHSANAVAVVFSDEKCAVDIEPVGRNVERVIRRVATNEELSLSDNRLLNLVIWCAKECLYKLSGLESVDFRRDIVIREVDFDRGELRGSICNSEEVRLKMEIRCGNVVVTNVADSGKIG